MTIFYFFLRQIVTLQQWLSWNLIDQATAEMKGICHHTLLSFPFGFLFISFTLYTRYTGYSHDSPCLILLLPPIMPLFSFLSHSKVYCFVVLFLLLLLLLFGVFLFCFFDSLSLTRAICVTVTLELSVGAWWAQK